MYSVHVFLGKGITISHIVTKEQGIISVAVSLH